MPEARFCGQINIEMMNKPFYIFFALTFFFVAPASLVPLSSSGVALAQSKAPTTFGHIRRLSLEEVRALALERAPAIAQARAKIEAAKAEEKELKKRIVPQVGGGIDPFSGQVRYYMNLDLQRLLQLNRAERQKAKRTVEAEQQGQTQAQNAAIASVTAAWFGLKRAEAGHATARRNLITAKAIFVSADARFRAGTGELGSVLSALNGKASHFPANILTQWELMHLKSVCKWDGPREGARLHLMDFHAHEDFEDEGLAAFIESASDDYIEFFDAVEEDEITVLRPMILRFACEDADQLVVKIAQMRHSARLFAEDARAALSPQLCGLAPKASDKLRAQLVAALDACDVAFALAVALEKAAVYAVREGVAPVEADDEEAELEANPPGPKPKVKIAPECQSLRRQFFAASSRVGLITKGTVRAARVAAVSKFIERAITTTDDLTEAEWLSCVYAVEDGRLQW